MKHRMSGKDSSQAETAGLVAASPKSPKSKGLRNSLISVFTSRGGSAEQSTSIDDSRYGGSSVIDASLAQISVARVRPEDEVDLKVKNSGFFKLFHKADLNSNNKMNVRYKAAVWSGVKPTFQSKLMVIALLRSCEPACTLSSSMAPHTVLQGRKVARSRQRGKCEGRCSHHPHIQIVSAGMAAAARRLLAQHFIHNCGTVPPAAVGAIH